MIKVKIDRPAPNVFYVEDGYTVTYEEDVLQVLNEDDETIAVFRDWLYAMPAEEIEEEEEDPALLIHQVLSAPDLGSIELAEADFHSEHDLASSVHANSHGDHEAPDAETTGPAS
jgi:hypothetical protein